MSQLSPHVDTTVAGTLEVALALVPVGTMATVAMTTTVRMASLKF